MLKIAPARIFSFRVKVTTKKMKNLLCLLFSLFTLQTYSQTTEENMKPAAKRDSGYAPVNGLKMYYEIYGVGKPLILIHGGVGAIEMWGSVLTTLSQNHSVIAVDLQAHGRTADIDRPLSFELMADDIVALIKYVKLDRADIMGYSLGGGVALQVAIRHPGIVNKLVVVSAPCKSDGWYPEIRSQMKQTGATGAEGMKQSPLYQLYKRLAPKPQDWPVLFTKLGQLLSKDYDWTLEVKQMKITTMIVVGDADAIRMTSTVEFFQLLGGAQRDAGWDGRGQPKSELAVLPNMTHYTISNSHALAIAVIPFLGKKD